MPLYTIGNLEKQKPRVYIKLTWCKIDDCIKWNIPWNISVSGAIVLVKIVNLFASEAV